MYGVCNLSIVPCRSEPSDKSEMVTQLLFGECFTINEIQKNWIRIKITYDGYECWIGDKQFEYISELHYNDLCSSKTSLSLDLVSIISNKNGGNIVPIILGSTLYLENSNQIILNNSTYLFEGNINSKDNFEHRNGIIECSFLYLNAPYLWGGRSPFGIDCSGFTQMVYKLNGISLLRDASQQATQGKILNFVEEALPGDLAFFDNDEGNIIHVGIVLAGNKIIHASGSVRIDEFDHQGIFNSNKKNYTHNLRLLKSLF